MRRAYPYRCDRHADRIGTAVCSNSIPACLPCCLRQLQRQMHASRLDLYFAFPHCMHMHIPQNSIRTVHDHRCGCVGYSGCLSSSCSKGRADDPRCLPMSFSLQCTHACDCGSLSCPIISLFFLSPTDHVHLSHFL